MMNERLSDWIDGELQEEEGARIAQSVLAHAAERETCEVYWLIDDALRGHAPAASDLSARVMAELQHEPTVLAPRPSAVKRMPLPMERWLPAAAAVAGVAVAAWMSLSLIGTPGGPVGQAAPTDMAAAPVAPEALQPTATMALSGNQAYYMAHQASALGAPMVGVAQYVRTVGDEQAGSR